MDIGWTTKEGPGLLSISILLSVEPYKEFLIHFFPRSNCGERHWGYEKEFYGTPFKSFGLGPLFSIQWLVA